MVNKNEQLVWNFANRLRTVIPFYGFSISAVELIFMKYMSEFEDVYSPEQFKTLMAYKNMFISKKFDESLTYNVFHIAEEIYSIENGLLSSAIDNIRKIFSEKQEYVFAILSEFELPKDKEEMINLVESILEYGQNKDVSRNGTSSTNSSLITLVRKILCVKDTETYMDCFSGFNKASFRLNAGNYLGYELNPEVAAISNMLMILMGKKRFSIKNQNFYLSKCHSVADKVFSDGPISLILTMNEYYELGQESKKSDYYNLKTAVDALKENGRAVVTCQGSVLFRNDFKSLRESLTFRNLKAVISLPPLWSFTSIPTNIVVFEKERIGNDVIMIDASSVDNLNKIDKRTVLLKDETINKIIESLNGKCIEGFSQAVPSEIILLGNENQSWVPSQYIIKKKNIDFRSSEEVKKDLELAYRELSELLSK